MFAKGHAKRGGRRRGTPNKVPVAVKEALEKTFAELGGVSYLADWARENPTEFYHLWVKLLPRPVEHGGAVGVQLAADLADPMEFYRRALAAEDEARAAAPQPGVAGACALFAEGKPE
jgi:hypothetical protein